MQARFTAEDRVPAHRSAVHRGACDRQPGAPAPHLRVFGPAAGVAPQSPDAIRRQGVAPVTAPFLVTAQRGAARWEGAFAPRVGLQ
jgi:hypothetical protein